MEIGAVTEKERVCMGKSHQDMVDMEFMLLPTADVWVPMRFYFPDRNYKFDDD